MCECAGEDFLRDHRWQKLSVQPGDEDGTQPSQSVFCPAGFKRVRNKTAPFILY